MSKKLVIILTAALMAAMLLGGAAAASAGPMPGAIFTTDIDGSVNINQYDAKCDVYLNGGPRREGSAGLPDGYYYIQVTTPNGVVLGFSNTAAVYVSGGEFDPGPVKLCDILFTASSDFSEPGYDDTTNNGGEYKVWASMDADFPNAMSKTDNFKVIEEAPVLGSICGYKFGDCNRNGIMDDYLPNDEYPLGGWEMVLEIYEGGVYVELDRETTAPDYDGTFCFTGLEMGTYRLSEVLKAGWAQTTPAGGYFDIILTEEDPDQGPFIFGNTTHLDD